MSAKRNESTQHSHQLKRIRLPGLAAVSLCGLLLTSAVGVQAASLKAQAGSGGPIPLAQYSDDTVSFLYPKAWFKQLVSGPNSIVLLSNDQTVLKTAGTSTPKLTQDQLVIEVLSGPAAVDQVTSLKTNGSALDFLKALVASSSSSTSKYGVPEAINLINATDAAEVTAQDTATKDDSLIIALSPRDHPVFILGLVAPGQLAAKQLIIQGIASTVQAGGASTAAAPATAAAGSGPTTVLSETFKNKIYTLNYPNGWVTNLNSADPTTVYLATDKSLVDAANSGNFSLSPGQILVGIISDRAVSAMTGTSPANPLPPADVVTKLRVQLVDSSSGILSRIADPSAVTIGTQQGAEALITLKSGGSGYIIAFYQNKLPILMIAFTADGEADASRALFEQIAASITLSTP